MNFEERIKLSLENSLKTMDEVTANQLQLIRRQALNQPVKKAWLSTLKNNLWVSASGLAFCSFIVALVLFPQLRHMDSPSTIEQTAMVELIEDPSEIEVISDPAFYLWLDEQEAQSV
jgi:hypothetical protein